MKSDDSLDSFDLKILAHLQRDGRCLNVELADLIGLSPSPCLLRTKRLQKIGLIRGFGAHIALEKLGEFVTVFSEVTLSAHSLQDFRKFDRKIAAYKEVIDCYNVSGGYDYLLKIVAPGIGHFCALMEKMMEDDIGIDKFASRIVLRQLLERREYPLSILSSRRST